MTDKERAEAYRVAAEFLKSEGYVASRVLSAKAKELDTPEPIDTRLGREATKDDIGKLVMVQDAGDITWEGPYRLISRGPAKCYADYGKWDHARLYVGPQHLQMRAWHGDECPVGYAELVAVECTDGKIKCGRADDFYWAYDDNDIAAYCVITTEVCSE